MLIFIAFLSIIGVEDADSSDERILFQLIESPECGFISFVQRPRIPINRFTQADLRKDKVLFTHTGND